MSEDLSGRSPKSVAVMARIAAVSSIVVFFAIAAPIIWSAVSAGVGLLALGGLLVVGVAVGQAIPFLGQKWENKLLAARKADARENPIEQLQNFLRAKAARVAQFRAAVQQIGTQIKSLEDMLADRRKAKPDADLSKQEGSLQAMKSAQALLVSKYQSAERALQELQVAIEDKKFDWNFAQAGQQAIKSLNATSGQELLDQMLADEAFSSVRDNFNSVFADLELEASRINNVQLLGDQSSGLVLDVSSIRIPDSLKV